MSPESDLHSAAVEHHQAGRAVEAVPYFRRITRLKRDDPRPLFDLAAALAGAGQTQLGDWTGVLERIAEELARLVRVGQGLP